MKRERERENSSRDWRSESILRFIFIYLTLNLFKKTHYEKKKRDINYWNEANKITTKKKKLITPLKEIKRERERLSYKRAWDYKKLLITRNQKQTNHKKVKI